MPSESLIAIWKYKASNGDQNAIDKLRENDISYEDSSDSLENESVSTFKEQTRPKSHRRSDGKRRTIYIKNDELWERAVKTGNVSKLITKLLEWYFKRKDKQVNTTQTNKNYEEDEENE